MATKSIYKNINIKDKKPGRALVTALENAKEFKGKEVVLTKKCQKIKKDQLKEFFGDK